MGQLSVRTRMEEKDLSTTTGKGRPPRRPVRVPAGCLMESRFAPCECLLNWGSRPVTMKRPFLVKDICSTNLHLEMNRDRLSEELSHEEGKKRHASAEPIIDPSRTGGGEVLLDKIHLFLQSDLVVSHSTTEQLLRDKK